ncbi:MAG: Lipid A core-O-antigen ligase-like protein enyme [Candidatus Woesebacteria bacterium GW2011_GWD1_47_21]|uniref:Lipid A core-O-antigen ligase-like protein enyme n=1 Tax=Candidatus Woesebacteria bacterium GW2011_GWD1_47_21 TaxID=1618594 RepID=A0A0G1SMD2_9BACT|nr:MAG: Lipid A core-O-antigen ligase-like protein enyme [Candidatus Woesebacteria bacterium GW2011_GWD1_47_21]
MRETRDTLLLNRKNNLVLAALIFLIPTQVGYHFWPDFAHVFGIRVDYLSPAIYLTDLLVLLLFFLWAKTKPKINRKTIARLIFLMLFAFVNILLAKNTGAALYKWIKIFEFVFFGYYLFSLKGVDIKKQIMRPLGLSLLFFSSVGILQFIKQGTIGGLLYFLGERSFTASLPGIALVDIGGSQYLRAYSTFSHPNSLAGFLATGLILLAFSKESRRFKMVVFTLGLAALLFSFSLGALLGLVVVLLFYLTVRILPKTFKKGLLAIVFLAIVLSLAQTVYSRSYLKADDLAEDVHNRLVLAVAAGELSSSSPIWGVGLNNFIVRLPEIKSVAGFSVGRQPVHNIFLLALAEAGIPGLLLLTLLLTKAASTAAKNGKILFGLAIIFMVVTGLVDHYWLTLQQNQLLASLVLGLSLREGS